MVVIKLELTDAAQAVAAKAERMGRLEQLGGYEGIAALLEYHAKLGDVVDPDIVGWCCEWEYLTPDDPDAEDAEEVIPLGAGRLVRRR